MTARQQLGVVAGVVLLAATALLVLRTFLGDELSPVGTGKRAPDFQAVTLDTVPVPRTLADYAGRVVVLNVWATWCAPCRAEMPSMEQLHRAYAPKGLRVVAVSIDDPGSAPAIRAFARELGLTFEILHDETGAIRQAYQTTGVPETMIIGKDGVIRKKIAGALDWNSDANRALVARLLAE